MATFNQIMTDLKNKKYKPVYLLMGEETYYIDEISNYITKNVIPQDQQAFNLTVVYGKDTDVTTIDHAARRFPMMSKYQVVVVKEAQNLAKIENLEFYARKPSPSTILVINYKYKKIDKRKKFLKEVEKNGVLFESKKIYENKVPEWINQYLLDKGYSIDPVASTLLTEFLGNDLSKISNELDKLTISLPQGTKIASKHIEENIGISKDYNNFELQAAIGKKDIKKVNRIAWYYAENPKEHPLIKTITSLYYYFAKLLTYQFLQDKSKMSVASALQVNPYFVRDYETAARHFKIPKLVQIIGWLREYDVKVKGVGNVSTNQGDLLKELIYKIMH